jgi:hypothetical protein
MNEIRRLHYILQSSFTIDTIIPGTHVHLILIYYVKFSSIFIRLILMGHLGNLPALYTLASPRLASPLLHMKVTYKHVRFVKLKN